MQLAATMAPLLCRYVCRAPLVFSLTCCRQTFTGSSCTTSPTSVASYNPGCVSSGGISVQTTCSSFVGSPSLTTATLTFTFSTSLNAQQVVALQNLVQLYTGLTVTVTATATTGVYTVTLSGSNAGLWGNGIIANARFNDAWFNQQNATVPAGVRVASASAFAAAWVLLAAVLLMFL